MSLVAPVSLNTLLDQPIVDLLLHHIDVLENLLLSLLARHVHHNEVLDIILIPLRLLGQFETIKDGADL